MGLGLAFWIIMLLWLVLWLLGATGYWHHSGVSNAVLFLLFLIVGWKVFGSPIQG